MTLPKPIFQLNSQDKTLTPCHVLIFDNGENLLSTICRGLFLYGYKCIPISNPDMVLQLVQGQPLENVLLVDLSTKGRAGFELIEQVHSTQPRFPILAIAGLQITPEIETIQEWEIEIIHKPFSAELLSEVIGTLCQSFDDTKQNSESR